MDDSKKASGLSLHALPCVHAPSAGHTLLLSVTDHSIAFDLRVRCALGAHYLGGGRCLLDGAVAVQSPRVQSCNTEVQLRVDVGSLPECYPLVCAVPMCYLAMLTSGLASNLTHTRAWTLSVQTHTHTPSCALHAHAHLLRGDHARPQGGVPRWWSQCYL